MAKKVKDAVNKLLDKTKLDDKLVSAYKDAKETGLLDKIKCYTGCYGGYVLAVGAGCLFGTSFWWGVGFLAAAVLWARKFTCAKTCPK